MAVYLTVDFFQKIRRFAKYDPSVMDTLLYFTLRIPKTVLDLAPLSVLMAVLLTLGLLSRHSEIIAMKNSGISPIRIGLPLFVMGLIISVVLSAANLTVVPLSNQRADYVRYITIQKRPPDIHFKQSRIWLRPDRERFMNIKFSDSKNSVLLGVNIYRLNKDFSITEIIDAERIQYNQGKWIVFNGTKRIFHPDGRIESMPLEGFEISLNRTPEDFTRIEKDTDKMTYRELATYVNKLEEDDYSAQRYKVDLYNKMAMPFMSFVIGFIGIPLALGSPMGHGISRTVGLSLIIALVYWIIYSLSIALGYGNVLPAVLSAWLPNILFTLAGFFLMFGLRR